MVKNAPPSQNLTIIGHQHLTCPEKFKFPSPSLSISQCEISHYFTIKKVPLGCLKKSIWRDNVPTRGEGGKNLKMFLLKIPYSRELFFRGGGSNNYFLFPF